MHIWLHRYPCYFKKTLLSFLPDKIFRRKRNVNDGNETHRNCSTLLCFYKFKITFFGDKGKNIRGNLIQKLKSSRFKQSYEYLIFHVWKLLIGAFKQLLIVCLHTKNDLILVKRSLLYEVMDI